MKSLGKRTSPSDPPPFRPPDPLPPLSIYQTDGSLFSLKSRETRLRGARPGCNLTVDSAVYWGLKTGDHPIAQKLIFTIISKAKWNRRLTVPQPLFTCETKANGYITFAQYLRNKKVCFGFGVTNCSATGIHNGHQQTNDYWALRWEPGSAIWDQYVSNRRSMGANQRIADSAVGKQKLSYKPLVCLLLLLPFFYELSVLHNALWPQGPRIKFPFCWSRGGATFLSFLGFEYRILKKKVTYFYIVLWFSPSSAAFLFDLGGKARSP